MLWKACQVRPGDRSFSSCRPFRLVCQAGEEVGVAGPERGMSPARWSIGFAAPLCHHKCGQEGLLVGRRERSSVKEAIEMDAGVFIREPCCECIVTAFCEHLRNLSHDRATDPTSTPYSYVFSGDQYSHGVSVMMRLARALTRRLVCRTRFSIAAK